MKAFPVVSSGIPIGIIYLEPDVVDNIAKTIREWDRVLGITFKDEEGKIEIVNFNLDCVRPKK